MAIKKIEMRPEGTNDYADVIYPMTSIDIIDGYGHYAVASGTNAYTVSIPRITSLIAGTKVVVKFTNANSGASTININGLGAKSIIKPGGGNPNIKANGVYTLIYDGTSFQLQGEGGEYGTALSSDVLQGKTIGTDNGIITGTIPIRSNSDTSGSYPVAVKSSYTPGISYLMPPRGYYDGNIWVKMDEPDLQPANFLAGKTIGKGSTVMTGTMPNRGAVTSTLTTQGGVYTIPAGYHNGSGKITASLANLVAGNIKSGVNIGGVVGSLSLSDLLPPSGDLFSRGDNFHNFNSTQWSNVVGKSFFIVLGNAKDSTSSGEYLGYFTLSGTFTNPIVTTHKEYQTSVGYKMRTHAYSSGVPAQYVRLAVTGSSDSYSKGISMLIPCL